jgi:hypothetical protein
LGPHTAATFSSIQRVHHLRHGSDSQRKQALLHVLGDLAHWCTIRMSVISDGLLMRPRCCQVIALLA